MLLIGSTYAQNRQVSGKVTSASNGSPIAGVSVKVSGTSSSTQTAADGTYNIQVPDNNGTLSFSYIGYTSAELSIGNRSVINVQLLPDEESLEEVRSESTRL